MSRGPRTYSEARLAKWERAGRGQGRGPNYVPWIKNSDFSSRGVAHRMYSPKVGRTVELFSNIERDVFIALEARPDVVDIREQFPLERTRTLEAAAHLGIKHPKYPGTNVNAVMTLDFVVTVQSADGLVDEAVDCKHSQEAENARSIEKLELSRTVCERIGMRHHLVYGDLIPREPLANLRWIREGYLREAEQLPSPDFFEIHQQQVYEQLAGASPTQPLHAFCRAYDAAAGVDCGTGIRAVRMLLFRRAITTDLRVRHLWLQPVSAFVRNGSVSGARGGRRS